jgi:hypothetical protein
MVDTTGTAVRAHETENASSITFASEIFFSAA